MFLLHLCAWRETVLVQFERCADASVNLRRLLARQQRVVVRQLTRQLLNITQEVRHSSNQTLERERVEITQSL